MSGFTGSGYPKAVPLALANASRPNTWPADPFRVRVWTGASTGPELDGALAKSTASTFACRTIPIRRARPHQSRRHGIFRYASEPGRADGVAGFPRSARHRADRSHRHPARRQLIPSPRSVTTRPGWSARTRSSSRSTPGRTLRSEGMHDIYYGTALPPHRVPIPLVRPTTASASRISAAIPTRSSRSLRRIARPQPSVCAAR